MTTHLAPGYRSLHRTPLLALTIIATLGSALAATVLVFSFLNSFLLRPLPYGDTSRVLVIYEHSLEGGHENSTRVTYGNAVAVEERSTVFARTGIFRNESATYHGGDATETAFALLAVALALAGIYAVNSFFVERRMSEFGIRAALGASAPNLLRLVLGDSLRLTALGLAMGLVLAGLASRGFSALLYNVPALDPLIYLGAALVMTVAYAGATLLPAKRAAKADPLVALRAE